MHSEADLTNDRSSRSGYLSILLAVPQVLWREGGGQRVALSGECLSPAEMSFFRVLRQVVVKERAEGWKNSELRIVKSEKVEFG